MTELSELFALSTSNRNRLPLSLFLLLCFNLLILPAVQAATPGAEYRFRLTQSLCSELLP
ncbi:hypothetical protein [Trichormus azollae]|nr:hypothetical protein [Trichormus azollae]